MTGERSEKATIAKAVTLEVSAEDAQKILLATNIGRLSLILRQPAEANSEPVRRVTEHDLIDAPRPVAHAQTPPPALARTTKRTITIWHGVAKAEQYERPID